MKKETKGQEVIRLMGQGWRLIYDRRYYLSTQSGSFWEPVNGNTVKSLKRKGLIKALPYVIGSFESEYVLTEEGKK